MNAPHSRLASVYGVLRLLASLALCVACSFASSHALAQERALQPGDELLIVIPERGVAQERTVTIDANGEVPLGLYGRVELAGLSPEDARRALRSHLSTYLRSTGAVYLTLLHPRTLVFVTGMVAAPGLQTIDDGADLWGAIQSAGGTIDGADLSGVRILSANDELDVDVRAWLTREGSAELPRVQPGDTIFVPARAGLPPAPDSAGAFLSAGALDGRVFVLGAVVSPGLYDRAPGMDALGAIGLAGGPAPGARLDQTRVLLGDDSRTIDVAALLDGAAVDGASLDGEGGAIVFVPHPGALGHNPSADGIAVIGGLNGAGFVETAVPLPITEVIALAGGPTTEANLSRVRHVQQGATYSAATHYNLARFLRRGGALGHVLIRPGDTLYLAERQRGWETFIGVVSDIAIIASSVVVFATLTAN